MPPTEVWGAHMSPQGLRQAARWTRKPALNACYAWPARPCRGAEGDGATNIVSKEMCWEKKGEKYKSLPLWLWVCASVMLYACVFVCLVVACLHLYHAWWGMLIRYSTACFTHLHINIYQSICVRRVVKSDWRMCWNTSVCIWNGSVNHCFFLALTNKISTAKIRPENIPSVQRNCHDLLWGHNRYCSRNTFKVQQRNSKSQDGNDRTLTETPRAPTSEGNKLIGWKGKRLERQSPPQVCLRRTQSLHKIKPMAPKLTDGLANERAVGLWK